MHCACSSSVGCVSWKETARTRKNNSAFRKTVLPHILNTRKGIDLQRKQILLVPNTSKIISEKWLFVFENKYYGKTPIACCLKIKRSVEKKKEKVFFLFCFPLARPFIIAPMSHSQLPNVKYVYAVGYVRGRG
jgi:hypothetical protein